MSAQDGHDPELDDVLLGALAEGMMPAHPDRATTERLRARLLEAVREQPVGPGCDHLTIRADEGEWVRLAPGVRMKLLREDEHTRSYLLRMRAGAVLPAHDHEMDEECMVLEGDIWLGDVHAHAGDFHLARRHVPHGALRSETGCLLFLRGQKAYVARGAG